jgi:hypothetical protein
MPEARAFEPRVNIGGFFSPCIDGCVTGRSTLGSMLYFARRMWPERLSFLPGLPSE